MKTTNEMLASVCWRRGRAAPTEAEDAHEETAFPFSRRTDLATATPRVELLPPPEPKAALAGRL